MNIFNRAREHYYKARERATSARASRLEAKAVHAERMTQQLEREYTALQKVENMHKLEERINKEHPSTVNKVMSYVKEHRALSQAAKPKGTRRAKSEMQRQQGNIFHGGAFSQQGTRGLDLSTPGLKFGSSSGRSPFLASPRKKLQESKKRNERVVIYLKR